MQKNIYHSSSKINCVKDNHQLYSSLNKINNKISNVEITDEKINKSMSVGKPINMRLKYENPNIYAGTSGTK